MGDLHETLAPRRASADSPSLASRMPRGVARPVLRALGGDVLPQWSNAPSFDPMAPVRAQRYCVFIHRE